MAIPTATCNPEECPLEETCPVGPTPNLPCKIKAAFLDELNDQFAKSFKDIDSNPDVKIRVNMMLRPLFEQLLSLRMAERKNGAALFGTKANPLMKEIRQVILAIDKVITETVRLQHEGPIRHTANKKPDRPGSALDMGSKSYYEMLMIEGTGSVEKRVGIDDHLAAEE